MTITKVLGNLFKVNIKSIHKSQFYQSKTSLTFFSMREYIYN